MSFNDGLKSSDIDSSADEEELEDDILDDDDVEDEVMEEGNVNKKIDPNNNNNNKTTTTTTTTTSTSKNTNGTDNSDGSKKRTKTQIISEIDELLAERGQIENKLASLEKQIYALEGRYLEETHHIGNVIRGWDSYISGSGALKKLRWREVDRLFSQSSSSYLTSINTPTGDDNVVVPEDPPSIQNIAKKKSKDQKVSKNSKKNY
ncbi:hypothetical protein CYY_005711 [Polysphondylium violaceum]|uniref:Chromatin modification-related protein MEAF6 n=1 Tax=Polysphondylium violaceum TaxID=133409 RepID=A0A8J4Q2J3_9MYCE|nr:hypothetical protein CYY_005711 [Polysphondylium violaceum]